jgi:hypothetical protein
MALYAPAGTAFFILHAHWADSGRELAEFNGQANHVHLLVSFPPALALSRLVNSLKGVSSRRLRQEFPDLARHYWRAKRLWSSSYLADSTRGRAHLGPAPVHRAAGPPVRTGSRPPAFTTGLKAGALAGT